MAKEYIISPYGFFTLNYEAVNVKDEEDTFEVEQNFSLWCYHATMDHDRYGVNQINENWDWTFDLIDKKGKCFATFNRHMDDLCSPEYYEVVKPGDNDESSEKSDESSCSSERRNNTWLTIHEDQEWFEEPDFVFRNVERGDEARTVAKLSCVSTLCAQEYRLRISSSCRKNDIPTIVASSIIIIRLVERRRNQNSTAASTAA